MRTGSTIADAVERVARIATAHDDALSLRAALVAEMRLTVGFDAYAWLLTDPATEVGGSPLAEVPWVADLPRQIRLKYLTGLNRWTSLDDPPAAGLRATTDDRPEKSLVWRDFLSNHGVNDAASVVFRDRFGCWGFLEAWRFGREAAFTKTEIGFFTAITGSVTTAVRRCQARTFDLQAPVPDRAGPVVMVLSPLLEVRAQTPETEKFLRRLVPPGADERPIPAGAYNVAAQLLAVEAGVDDHPASARVHLSGGVWLTLQAARIGDPASGGDIAVTIERAAPAERLDLFARASGLSPRESELLGHLAGGADTRQVAARMFLSEHTVQDHLKGIFAKTGADNRRSLIARVTGS